MGARPRRAVEAWRYEFSIKHIVSRLSYYLSYFDVSTYFYAVAVAKNKKCKQCFRTFSQSETDEWLILPWNILLGFVNI